MDFSFNEIQSMLDDSVEKFIANDYDFETRQKYAASKRGYSPEVWQTFAELGWTSVPFSEDDGGFGGGPTDLMVLMLRFGKGLVVEPYLANIVLAGGVLRRAASAEQKERWLQPIIAGELQSALAYTEPQSRYDIADIRTTATADGDGWVLSGEKGVVFNGGNAELLIVAARISGAQDDEDGITLFAVPADSDGLDVRSYATVDGQQAAEISLDNVAVDGAGVIGEPGKGLAALDAAIDDATLAVCAEAVGIMQIMTDKTVEYSKNRMLLAVAVGDDACRTGRRRCETRHALDQIPGRHRGAQGRPGSGADPWRHGRQLGSRYRALLQAPDDDRPDSRQCRLASRQAGRLVAVCSRRP
jgi:alkylation response protein AidB-like acyl-CoA dehydrogenase